MVWTDREAALVIAVIHWFVESDVRPNSGPGSDTSDLMRTLLDEIQGICDGSIDPREFVMTKEAG